MRHISIGIDWQGAFDLEDMIEHAKVADDAGVDSLFVAEAWGRDAFSLLAVLARETHHIKLGTSIVNVYSRSAAAIAQHFATLDEISNGRMVIGLGSSGPNVIEHFHGVKFEQPLRRIREYVDIINMLMREEPLNYDGRLHHLERGFTLRFHPRRPHIPIFVAAITPRSVRQTAAIADGWFPIFIPRPRWREQLDAFRSSVRAAGRDPDDVVVRNPNTVAVTDDPSAVREETARRVAFYIARMGDFYYEHFLRMGYADEANAVRRAWEASGSSAGAAAVPADLVEALGAAGSVDECIEAMEAAEEAGFGLHPVSVAEPDRAKRGEILRRLVG